MPISGLELDIILQDNGYPTRAVGRLNDICNKIVRESCKAHIQLMMNIKAIRAELGEYADTFSNEIIEMNFKITTDAYSVSAYQTPPWISQNQVAKNLVFLAIKCPKCGKVNPQNAQYCWNDGTFLKET